MSKGEAIKAKGDELIKEFMKEIDLFTGGQERHSKTFSVRCAIIAVEEIIKLPESLNGRYIPVSSVDYNHWNEVLNYLKSKL